MAEPLSVTATEVGAWRVEHRRGSAAALHEAPVRDDVGPSVWICEPTRPALVLGSTQRGHVVPPGLLAAGGVDLVVRRSGGGAVLLVPGSTTWVDLVIPAHHHRWDPDVGRATHWVGDLWADVLTAVGVGATVHHGPMQPTEWSRTVCFAGIGPGEVLDPSGHKLVGVSQRRTRQAARFQTVAHHRTDPAAVVELLGLDVDDRDAAVAVTKATSRSLEVTSPQVLDALVTALADLA